MAKLQEDVRRLRFWRALIAEFLGVMFIVLIGCGAWTHTDAREALSSVRVALAFGLTLAAVLFSVRALGHAQLNPAVTVAMLVTRRTSVVKAGLFVVCQLLGGILGAALLRAISPWDEVHEMGCNKNLPGVSEGQGFGVEFFGAFFFVFVIFACYDVTVKEEDSVRPFVIGLTYTAVQLFAIPYTRGSINTARSFGPSLINNVWKAHWIFWFGPLLGGISGGGVYDLIFSTRASFKRLRDCLFVFHRRPDDPKGKEDPLASRDLEQGRDEFQDLTEVPTPTALDEEDEDVEGEKKGGRATEGAYTGVGSGGGRSTLHDSSPGKSRHFKLFNPKFACWGRQQPAEPADAYRPASAAQSLQQQPGRTAQSQQQSELAARQQPDSGDKPDKETQTGESSQST